MNFDQLVAMRPMNLIANIDDRNNVVLMLDTLLPTDEPIVQLFCDFQASVLDIYDRANGLAFTAEID